MNNSSLKTKESPILESNLLDIFSPRDNRGKKPGDISAKKLFQLMDAGFTIAEVRHAVEHEDLNTLEEMTKFAKFKQKPKAVRIGRPVSEAVKQILESCGITVEKLYQMDEFSRKRILARARMAANSIK